jgi:chromosome segregation protein
LYRDGSSDYELNGVACRLLDIQDLLSDSGVGRHQHLIIGQGEIGQILSASPEENRSVIEEAAGILKHRRRKERAERRLDRTAEDLVRLGDILTEIVRQMRPLKRQARAAERYDGLKAEVVSLRLYLGGKTLAAHDRELTMATSERAELLETVEVDLKTMASLEDRLTSLRETASSLKADLDRDTTAAALIETTSERLRRIASVAKERRRAQSGQARLSEERVGDLVGERAEIDLELEGLGSSRDQLIGLVAQAEARFRRLEDAESALATQTSLAPEGALAAVRGELSATEAAIARDTREIEAIDQRVAMLASRLEAETSEIADLNAEVHMMDSTISTLQADYRAATTKREYDQGEWSGHEEDLAKARVAVASAEARVEAIASALEKSDDRDLRARLLKAPGAGGELLARLDVPLGLEAAVEAALGPWVEGVVFDDRESAQGATADVKSFGAGPVTVVTPATSVGNAAREVAAAGGLEAIVDLLGPGADLLIADRFLGDVLLAQGWISAWDTVRSHPEVRVVTPEGDLFTRDGARLARPDGVGPVMLESAEVALERAKTDEARAHSHVVTARRAFEASRDLERRCLEALETAEAALSGTVEAMSRLGQSVAAVEAEMMHLEQRRQALGEAITFAEGHKKALTDQIEPLQGEEVTRAQAWEEMNARRTRLGEEREEARSDWQTAAARLQGSAERGERLLARWERVIADLERLDTGEVPRGSALEAVEEFARRGLAILDDRLTGLRIRQADLRAGTDEATASLSEADTAHARCRTSV